MKISTKGRYALRMMIDLAQQNSDEYIALKDISGRQNLSVKYLEQITSTLAQAGLVLSIRGPQGGYKMARRPSEYTIGDILRATEGSLAPVQCLEGEINECPRAGECTTLTFWTGFKKAIDDYVDSITLEDIITQGNGNNYMI